MVHQHNLVETNIGIQFAPIRGFRTGHFGWFWCEFLQGYGWEVIEDEGLIPTYSESFESFKLKLIKANVVSPPVRMKLRNATRDQSLQLQPNKLYYTWNRESSDARSFSEAENYFAEVYELLVRFCDKMSIGPVRADLWDVTYINEIQSCEPREWHEVLPSLFPPLAETNGLRFATYEGNWHYEIEPKRGRIHLNIAKVIRDGHITPRMYVKLVARGELGPDSDWKQGIQLGHSSCVKLFREVIATANRETLEEVTP